MFTKLLKKILVKVSFYTLLGIAAQCIFYSVLLASSGNAQVKSIDDIQLSINVEGQSIEEVFSTVENITGFHFAYKKSAINRKARVTRFQRDTTLGALLRHIAENSELTFLRVNDVIHVKKQEDSPARALVQEMKMVQTLQVTGKVTSAEDGESLPGVNIIEKGRTNGTVTDVEGRYNITVNENAILVFSSVGFTTEEVAVQGRAMINLSLVADIKQLQELVVVGYGVQKRSDITGSVASVPKDRLSNLPVTNLTHALQGSTAGLSITQESSVPGSDASIQVRGINSINASRSPFIVLDGSPFFGSTNDINPADVESIEVLKDASAVAIYGTRGSNGVILITTKRGSADGKPKISYNVYAGMEDIAHILEPRDPAAYVQKYKDYHTQMNLPQSDALPNAKEVDNYNKGLTTDWIDVATQPGRIQEHNLTVSGGASNVDYFISTGHQRQQGVIKGYEYQRTSIRANLDVKVTNYLKLGVSSFFTDRNTDGGRANLLTASAMSPYSLPYDQDGNIDRFPMFPEELYYNPLVGTVNDRLERDRNLSGTGYAEITPSFLEGFKYRLSGTYAYRLGRQGRYNPIEFDLNGGTASAEHSERADWVVENLFLYAKDFGRHHIDLTGLYSAQQNNYYRFEGTSSGFINNALSFYELLAGTSQSVDSESDQNTLTSQMARINYVYDSRYMLTLTARRDSYSNFGAANKHAIFPSMALGWNLHNEGFMKNNSLFSELKFRFSYGRTGNQAVNPNNSKTQTLANAKQYPFGGTVLTGVLFEELGNQSLHWENTTASNLALDFGIFQDRINGTVEVYRTLSRDLLLQRNLPNISGYEKIWDNLGEMQNTGLELTLNTVNIDNGDFKWESNINFSTYKNEVLELYGDGKDDIGNNWFIGHPLRVIYGQKKIGVWQVGEEASDTDPDAKPGYMKFQNLLNVDTDNDGVFDATDGRINADDRVIIGQRDPKWTGGFSNTFQYKNFHLTVFLQTAQGGMKENRDLRYQDEMHRRNLPKDVGYWTEENKSNYWPSLASASNANNRGYHWAEDWSYIRLKDVRLSYTAPQTFIGKYNISGLTIYASGRNLHTFTKWIGWDPEMNYAGRGGDGWTDNYPVVRTISLGLNVTL